MEGSETGPRAGGASDKSEPGINSSARLSAHVRRYNGLSQQGLESFIAVLKKHFVPGAIIDLDNLGWLVDFVENLGELYLASKQEAKSAKVESDKMQQRLAANQVVLDKSMGVDTAIPSCRALEVVAVTNAWDLPNVKQINLKSLVKKPRYFDGENPMPREWIEEYKDAIDDNFWSDQTAIYYFKHFLTDDAAIWFKLSVRPQIKSDWKWSNLYKLFEENYLGRAEKDRVKLLLREMRMQPEDRATNFIPRVRQYLLMLSPNMNEEDQVSNITEKLRAEYATAIVDKDPSTINELRDVCRKVEAGKDLQKAAVSFTTKRDQDRSNIKGLGRKNFSHNNKNSKETINKEDKSTEPRRVCHRCGRNNHLIRNCRATFKIDGTVLTDRPQRKAGQVNAIAADPDSNQVVEDDSQADDQSDAEVEVICNAVIASTASSPTKRNWLLATLRCNKSEVKAVVDSGSEKCVISEAEARKHNWRILPETKVKLTGANKVGLNILGSVILDTHLTIGNITKRKKQRWFVAKELAAPMLMGADLMVDFDILTDMKRKNIAFYAQQGFRTIKDIEVPARSQMIVPTTVDANGLVMTVNFTTGSNLEVAHSVSEALCHQTETLVLNPTDKPILLQKGTKLADVEVLEPLEDSSHSELPKTMIGAVLQLPESQKFVNIGDNLTTEQIEDVKKLLDEFSNAFSLTGEIGCAKGVEHQIELESGAKPFVEPARRRPKVHVDETAKQVKEMQENGIIEESSSPWSSAYVVVKKKNGDYRVCIDFRKLNAMTRKNAYPLPNIESCLEALSGKRFFSNFDLCSGYWQMEMAANSREYTAFRTEQGHFQFRRMPFGLCNAPASFQRLMNKKFANLSGLNLQVYLDDVCLASFTWPEHKAAIRTFFMVVIESQIKLNAAKCTLGAESIIFLGHIISPKGIQQDPAKLAALTQMPRPINVHEVRRLIGMMNYYRRFVPNFAALATPLTMLTRKKVTFVWGTEQEEAFNSLVTALSQNAILVHFNNVDPIMLKTDASRSGVAGILLQKQEGEWRMVCCHSRKLNDAERNYGITHLEGLAVVDSMLKFRPYLLGRPFELLTDHSALKVLAERHSKNQRIKRWQLVLSEFDFKVTYVKGALHADVDCLSRAPVSDPNDYILDDKVCTILIPINREDWAYESEEDLKILDNAVKLEDQLRVIDDMVYRKDKLYVPTRQRAKVVEEAHDSARGGHGGQQVTVAKLGGFWWPGLVKDTIDYVKSCLPCQLRKSERALPIGGMQQFEAYHPFDMLAIDTLGPLPESLSGYRYVIVAVDIFTRFIEARPIKELKAQECASFLLELFGRFGPPKKVVTDNGPQFLNDLVGDTLKVFGITQRWSTADHSQGNAPAERAIQSFQEKLSLAQLSPRELDAWDSIIPTIVLAINTSVSSSTGYSPFEMMFGREPEIHDNLVSRRSSPKDLHTQLVKARLDKIFSRAIENQEASKQATRGNFARNHRERSYAIGDLVSMRNPNRRKGKLDMRFDGPYKILEEKQKDIYSIEKMSTGAKFVRHSASLKPHFVRPVLDAVQSIQRAKSPGPPESNRDKSGPSLNNNQACANITTTSSVSEQQTNHGGQHTKETASRSSERVGRQQRSNHSPITLILMSILLVSTTTYLSQAAFQREPNQMWVWKDVSVLGNFVEYDIAVIIKSPCKSLMAETARFNHTKMETSYAAGSKSESSSLHLTMQDKCHQFDSQIFEVAMANLVQLCSFDSKSHLDNPYSKRGYVTGLIGGVFGGFSGCVVMDLVSTVWAYINPNSNYNRINNVEAQLDQLEEKHGAALNAFKNVTSQVVKTFNSTVNQVLQTKGELHQLFTDLPEYIFGASYILDYIIHGARLLNQIMATCEKEVNLLALAEFLQLPELALIDPRDAKWLSISSPRLGALRFRFRVAKRSADTSFQAVEAFDIWDFSVFPFARKRYVGAKTMLFNRTSNCAKAMDMPEGHLVTGRCTKDNYVDPDLRKWDTIKTTTNIRDEKQVTQVKIAGSAIWIYCPFGNITVEGRSTPCPHYVFSLPAGTAFSTADHDQPAGEVRQSNQLKNIDTRLAANFIHAVGPEDFDLVDSLIKLEEAASIMNGTSGPMTKIEPQSQWMLLCLLAVVCHLLGMATLVTFSHYRSGAESGNQDKRFFFGVTNPAPKLQITTELPLDTLPVASTSKK